MFWVTFLQIFSMFFFYTARVTFWQFNPTSNEAFVIQLLFLWNLHEYPGVSFVLRFISSKTIFDRNRRQICTNVTYSLLCYNFLNFVNFTTLEWMDNLVLFRGNNLYCYCKFVKNHFVKWSFCNTNWPIRIGAIIGARIFKY